MKQIIFLLTLILGVSSLTFANDYVAIAKDGNVYDEASAKYITVNQNNEDVSVLPGMVFATSQHTPGWFKIEYSPGLHAFIPDQIIASEFKPITAGSYTITNNPNKKINVQGSDQNWTASVDGKNFKGINSDNILIFVDDNNKIEYSIVDLGSGPIAITYENSVTKFF